ncbi:MAG: type II secretion system protein [Bacillota bacterium]|nr:type II secretion system protein [Bacillota bacterium]
MINDKMKKTYRRMRLRPGFTLVEIIIALTLIAVVAVIFSSFLSKTFHLQMKQKSITQNAFTLQKSMERKIDEARKAPITDVANDVFVTGHQVLFKQVDDVGANHQFYTLVTEKRQIQEEVPTATLSDIKFVGARNPNFEYIPFSDSTGTVFIDNYKLKGRFELDSSKLKDTEYLSIRWFASGAGYASPSVTGIKTGVFYDLYPDFPQNYQLVQQDVYEDITIRETVFPLPLEDFAGRHLVLSVTPVTKYGVFGKSAVSKPVYIHGLTELDKIALHLDASAMKESDMTGNQVSRWTDLAKSGKVMNLVGTTGAEFVEAHTNSSFSGHSVLLKAGSKFVTTVSSTPVTVFVVSKGDFNRNNLILDYVDSLVIDTVNLPDNFKLNVFQGTARELGFKAETSDVEVAEFIVYSKKIFSSGGDIAQVEPGKKIQEYSGAKFRIANIELSPLESMVDFTVRATAGEKFVPPAEATGLFANKRKRAVKVEWDQVPNMNLFNMNDADEIYTFVGHAVGYPDKKVRMTVQMPPYTARLELNPSGEIAYMNNGSRVEYEVLAGNVLPPDFAPEIVIRSKTPGALKFKDGDNIVDTITLRGQKGSFEVVGTRFGLFSVEGQLGIQYASADVFASDAIVSLDASSSSSDHMDVMKKNGRNYVLTWKDLTGNDLHFGKIPVERDTHETWYKPRSIDQYLLFDSGADDGLYRTDLGKIGFELPLVDKSTDSTIVVVSELKDDKKGLLFSYGYDQSGLSAQTELNYQIRMDDTSDRNMVEIGSGTSLLRKRVNRDIDLDDKNIMVITNSDIGSGSARSSFYTKFRIYDKDHTDSAEQNIRLSGEERNSGFTIGGRYQSGNTAGYRCRDAFVGNVHEFMVFDRVLSEEEISAVVQYLREKWLKNDD